MGIEESVAARIADQYGLQVDPATLTAPLLELRRSNTLAEGDLLQDLLLQPSQLRRLAGKLTVGESYFFRHPEQLSAISTWVSERRASGKKLTIWSAGCSRGEELYSVGMRLLLDHGPGINREIILRGTDLDAAAIATAREGRYSLWSLRGTTLIEQQHFFRSDNGGFCVNEELRNWCRFDHLSIQEHLANWQDRDLSVVLFRNVGIYFSPDALMHVHREFSRVLLGDGLLVQAATDPCPPSSLFQGAQPMPVGVFVPRPDNFSSPSTTRCRDPLPAKPIENRSNRWNKLPRLRNPAVRSSKLEPRQVSDHDGALTCISALADHGEFEEAERKLAAFLTLHPQSPDALLLRGQFALHSGDSAAAVQALRSVLYLSPGHHLGRYWYVIALEHSGNSRAAREQVRELRRLLEPKNGSVGTLSAELEQAIRELVSGHP